MNLGDKITGGTAGDLNIVQLGKQKITIETTGPANITLGLWGPFATAEEAGAKPPLGVLRVAGVGKWGTHNCAAGFYALYVLSANSANFTYTIRQYKFTDEWKLKTQGK